MDAFQPVCSLPEHTPVYVSSPQIRGTLDIAWTCIGTLLLCTWTIQHLNVPIEVKHKITEKPECTHESEHTLSSICRHAYLSTRKVWWMFITLVAPEVIMGKAIVDNITARYVTPKLVAQARKDGVPWTLTHTFLADMGGFAIEFNDEDTFTEINLSQSSIEDTQQSTTETPSVMASGTVSTTSVSHIPVIAEETTAFLVIRPAHLWELSSETRAPHFWSNWIMRQIGGESSKYGERCIKAAEDQEEFYRSRLRSKKWRYHMNIWNEWPMGETRWREISNYTNLAEETVLSSTPADVRLQTQFSYYYNIMALRGDVWILDAQQLLSAREQGIIKKLPSITEDEIDDHSKGDTFIKAMALFHILWLIANLIVRGVQGLPVAQLEIMTLAFALCALITYVALWSKPQDVYARVYMRAECKPTDNIMKTLGRLGPTTFWYLRAETWVPNNAVHYLNIGSHAADAVRWPSVYMDCDTSLQLGMISALAGAILFGAVHLIAWNFEFPTQVERLLWRITCVLTMALPVLIMLTMRYFTEIRTTPFNVSLAVIKSLVAYLMGALMAAHVLSRGFIIIESLRALSSLPVNGFIDTDVLDVIPHIG